MRHQDRRADAALDAAVQNGFDEVPQKRYAVAAGELQQPRGGRIVADHRGGIALLDAAFEPEQELALRPAQLDRQGLRGAHLDHVLVILAESLRRLQSYAHSDVLSQYHEAGL